MKVILLITMITIVDGKPLHFEEVLSFMMNSKVTLDFCNTYIAPSFTRLITVEEGFESKSTADCYIQQ